MTDYNSDKNKQMTLYTQLQMFNRNTKEWNKRRQCKETMSFGYNSK